MNNILLSGGAVIFAVTLLLSLVGLFAAPKLIERSLLRPYYLTRNHEYWRLITSGFMHADLGHLLFNMITFYSFAFPLEGRMGTMSFVALYFTGMVLSELGTYIKHRNDPDYSCLGASGAILAVLFAYIVYFPTHTLYIIPIPVPIPAPLFAVGYLAYTWWSSRQAKGRINHDAHLGGALTGLAFVALTDPSAFKRLMEMVGG